MALPPTRATFAAQLDSSFMVAEWPGLSLTLYEALPLSGQAAAAHAFSLMFRGPVQPALEQGTYTLEHAVLGVLAIFLVPIGCSAAGMQYQAIFN